MTPEYLDLNFSTQGVRDVASPEGDTAHVDALKAVSGNVKYSEYEGVKHNSWDKAYAEPEFLPWLLAQRLNAVQSH